MDWYLVSSQLYFTINLEEIFYFNNKKCRIYAVFGVSQTPNNVVNEKGERSGYGYEYLQDIAGYAGWTYKYITSDWKNCFTQLENGEIDILGDISYTDERAENMLFSDMPMGEEKYYIYTDASNMDLTAGNLDSFEGKNIGVSKDNIVEDVLNEWESKYGLHTKHINVSTTIRNYGQTVET